MTYLNPANDPSILAALAGKEASLGNPSKDGQALVSTVAGARSWADAASGGGEAVLGVARTYTDTYQSITAAIPNDDTIPQIGEGTQLLSLSYTPKSATSILKVEADVFVRFSGTATVIGAIFLDSVSDAKGVGYFYCGSTTVDKMHIKAYVSAGDTSAHTLSLRLGIASGTVNINGNAGGRLLGGAMKSWLEVEELSDSIEGGGSGAAISFSVSQTAHGFAVLTPVFYDIANNVWAKAKADSADTLATHVVVAVADADNFTVGQAGKFTITGHGLAEGFWFVSADSAGAVAQTDGAYSNPVFFVIDADTVFLPSHRPLASEGMFGLSESVSVTAAITLGETAIGKLHVCSGTSADYTVILPSPAGHSGKYIGFHMDPALTKLVTLDAGVGLTIDGERYRKMRDREVAILRSDGATWTKVAGKTVPMSGCLRVGGNQTFNASTTTLLTNFTLSNSLDAPAAFQTAASSLFTILRPGKYRVVGGSITNSTNSSAGDTQIFLKKGSTQIKGNAMGRNASAFVPLYLETTQVFAEGDILRLYGYYAGGSFTTSFFYSGDSGMFSEFSVTEIPTW